MARNIYGYRKCSTETGYPELKSAQKDIIHLFIYCSLTCSSFEIELNFTQTFRKYTHLGAITPHLKTLGDENSEPRAPLWVDTSGWS